MEVFGSFVPWKNPTAVYAYGVGLAALVPVLGVVLGPVAIALGLVGLVVVRRKPEVRGDQLRRRGVILGALSTLLNAAAVWCIGRGLNWCDPLIPPDA